MHHTVLFLDYWCELYFNYNYWCGKIFRPGHTKNILYINQCWLLLHYSQFQFMKRCIIMTCLWIVVVICILIMTNKWLFWGLPTKHFLYMGMLKILSHVITFHFKKDCIEMFVFWILGKICISVVVDEKLFWNLGA